MIRGTPHYFVSSAKMFAKHPVVSLSLGAASVLSSAAICCGFGFIAAPWFGCELIAAQAFFLRGERVQRTPAWISAGAFLLAAILLVVAVGWITSIGLGVDMPTESQTGSGGQAYWDTMLLFGLGTLVAQCAMLPFLYAPFELVTHGGSVGGAALASARAVSERGIVSQLILAGTVNLVQALPTLLFALTAEWLFDRSTVPVAIALSLPLLFITIPVGQGMLSVAWNEGSKPSDKRTKQAVARPLTLALVFMFLAPPLAMALLGTTMAQPSSARLLAAPSGEVLLELTAPASDAGIQGTGLRVDWGGSGVSVEASDGGGVGRLPLLSKVSAIDSVRVVRVRDRYFLESIGEHGPEGVWLDGAGVRLDDSLSRRLSDRVSLWVLLGLMLTMLLTSWVLGRALANLGAASTSDEPGRLRAAQGQAWKRVLFLLPIALASVFSSIWSVI